MNKVIKQASVLILVTFISSLNAYENHAIRPWECASCFQKESFSSCISDDFENGICCANEECRSKFKYCSHNLSQNKYRMLTCPAYKCPDGPFVDTHTKMGETKEATREWGRNNIGFNCKYIIRADSEKLNGKIVIDIVRTEESHLYVYLLPNTFDEHRYHTHGILENNHFFKNVRSGTYRVPTDWSIWLVYHPGNKYGGIQVRSKVENFTEQDLGKLEGVWQPTATYFADHSKFGEEIKQVEKAVAEDLEAKLKYSHSPQDAARMKKRAKNNSGRESRNSMQTSHWRKNDFLN